MNHAPRAPLPLEQRLTQLLLGQGRLTQAQLAYAETTLRTSGGSWTQVLIIAGVPWGAVNAAWLQLGSPDEIPAPPSPFAGVPVGAAASPSAGPPVEDIPPRPEGATPAMLTPKPPTRQPLPAQGRLGPYQTSTLLGRGGMATVYLATHVETQQRVALKLMLSHLATDQQFVQRFLKEAQASQGLDHPNVVRVLSHGEDHGRYYMAFEYVDGGTLDHLLQNVGRLPWQVVVDAGLQLLGGVGHAHTKGIIHRDLKPANLLLSKSGVLKIADFGVAKQVGAVTLTQQGAMVGTPMYLSPEMAAGGTMDHRGDLYTVGVLLREMLCGGNPFYSENVASSIHRIVQGSYTTLFEENPCVPPLLEYVVERLMLRDPAHRYASAQDVINALRPLQLQVEADHPFLLTGLAEDPAVVVKRLCAVEARSYLARAQDLLKKTHVERPAAAFNLFRALRQEPTLEEAASLFDLLCKQEHYLFAPTQDARIQALEKTLVDVGDTPQALQQLAQLYRAEGNIHRAAGAWRRYLRLRPEDGYARNQLLALTQELPADLEGAGVPAPTLAAPAVETSGVFAAAKEAPAAVAATMTDRPSVLLPAPGRGSSSRAPVLSAPEPEPEEPTTRWARYAVLGAGVLVVALGLKLGGEWLRKFTERHVKPNHVTKTDGEPRPNPDPPVTPEGNPPDKALDARMASVVALCRQENWDECAREAQALKDAAGDGTPNEVLAHFLWGKALWGHGSNVQASDVLEQFVADHAASAEYPEALLRAGQAQRRGGDPTKAVETLGRLLRDSPNGVLAAEALVERGLAYAQKDLKQDAAADFKQALSRVGPSSDLHQQAEKGLAALNLPP